MKTGKRIAVGIIVGVLVLVLIVVGAGIYRWASSRYHNLPGLVRVDGCEVTIDGQSVGLSLEQAGNAAIIAGVAGQRGLPPRAASIALATAYQESAIRNIDYGDRDSLGLFQQRPSMGWGSAEQVTDPVYASGKFYEVLVTINDWQSDDIGAVAQAVQRSGYPDAYDKHVASARLVASALTGETPAVWSCRVEDPAEADPDQLLQLLTRVYRSTIKATEAPATADSPAQLTLTATSESIAWSAAALAQSWASQMGVTAVRVGQFNWQASENVLAGWIGTPADTTDPTTVVVSF